MKKNVYLSSFINEFFKEFIEMHIALLIDMFFKYD